MISLPVSFALSMAPALMLRSAFFGFLTKPIYQMPVRSFLYTFLFINVFLLLLIA